MSNDALYNMENKSALIIDEEKDITVLIKESDDEMVSDESLLIVALGVRLTEDEDFAQDMLMWFDKYTKEKTDTIIH